MALATEPSRPWSLLTLVKRRRGSAGLASNAQSRLALGAEWQLMNGGELTGRKPPAQRGTAMVAHISQQPQCGCLGTLALHDGLGVILPGVLGCGQTALGWENDRLSVRRWITMVEAM